MTHQLYEPVDEQSHIFTPNRFDSVRAHGFGVALSGADIQFLREFEEDAELTQRTARKKIALILRGLGGAGL